MNSLQIFWALVPCIICFGVEWQQTVGQDHPKAVVAGERSASQLPSPRIAELINGLGSSSFAEREAASLAILASGEAALVGLSEIGPTASFEVRQRAAMIRQRIEADKFASLSRSFLLDLDGSQSYGLPAWNKYRELVGSTRCSKLMFLEMIRQQPELARLVDVADDPHATPVALRSLEQLASIEAFRLREQFFDFREPRLGDAVGMLLVAATMPNQTPVEISDLIISYERQSFGGYISQPGYENCLSKLMSAWLPKTHRSMAPMAMDCALRHDLREGIEIAREHLTNNFDGDTRTLAFYCLARFGDETDVPRIMPLMSEQNVVDQFSRAAIGGEGIHISNSAPPGVVPRDSETSINMVVRINDLAITTAMILLDKDPCQLYPRYEPHSKLGFTLHSLAMPPEWVDEQQQSIDTWKQQHFPLQVGS